MKFENPRYGQDRSIAIPTTKNEQELKKCENRFKMLSSTIPDATMIDDSMARGIKYGIKLARTSFDLDQRMAEEVSTCLESKNPADKKRIAKLAKEASAMEKEILKQVAKEAKKHNLSVQDLQAYAEICKVFVESALIRNGGTTIDFPQGISKSNLSIVQECLLEAFARATSKNGELMCDISQISTSSNIV